jgi:hypothetical protein
MTAMRQRREASLEVLVYGRLAAVARAIIFTIVEVLPTRRIRAASFFGLVLHQFEASSVDCG